MAFPNPGNYGTDPGNFSGRDYALGRHYYGDGGSDGDPDEGGSCIGCLAAIAGIIVFFSLIGLVFLIV